MEHLAKDPIIEIYLNYTKSTEGSLRLPLFSETLLRLAAKNALGNVRPVESETLMLYRKLILFHYGTTYTAVDDLLKIMPCFDEDELLDCFDKYHIVHNQWQTFTKDYLMYFIRKNAFFALYTEWARRYVQLYSKLNSKLLRDQAVSIHTFFGWSTKCVAQWIRSFERTVLKGNWSDSKDNELVNISMEDLAISKIATDIKERLHPLINEEVQDRLKGLIDAKEKQKTFGRETGNTPPAKKRREETNMQTENNIIIVDAKITQDQESGQEEPIIEETVDDEDDLIQIYGISDFVPQMFDNSATEVVSVNGDEDNQVIGDEKATKYLSALQAYAVVNGLFDAVGLLDQIDSILRAKLDGKT